MTDPTRRNFLQASGAALGAGLLSGSSGIASGAFADGGETIRIGLIGCGGRGTGAAAQALATEGPVQLVAMADVFQSKMDGSYNGLKKKHKDQVDVPPDRRHIGFDGYKKALDTLDKGDVAIFTTPCAFRWVHFQHSK